MVTEITELGEIPTSGKVVIDFFATWCGPCKRIAPMYQELSQQFPSITFLKCDVDEAEDVASRYSVDSLPTFVFLKNGVVHGRIEGGNLDGVIQALEGLEKV
jgi:thioredoxin 1